MAKADHAWPMGFISKKIDALIISRKLDLSSYADYIA